MSCGQIALIEEGFTIKEYFASEIEKNAIKVTQENFPDTKQLGDVMNFVLEIKNDKKNPVRICPDQYLYAYGLCGKCSRRCPEWNFAVCNARL